jgi:signal transduction histidine kinase
MKLEDFLLRLLVRRRDRETISGDLLEEYREHVLPTKGRRAARFWYVRQILSFVSPPAWGLVIGVVLGALQLADTAFEPLSDDTAGAMMRILATMLVLWTLASIAAGRPSRRFRDALVAGALAGVATMAVINLTAILRVNIFLDEIRYRDDWINLVARFEASGSRSLREYANWEYVRATPMVLGLGAVAGGLCGAVAGVVNRMGGTPLTRASDQHAELVD